MPSLIKSCSLLVVLGALTYCTTTGTGNNTPEQRRQTILAMREEVLNDLFAIKPDVRSQLGDSAGYAVFSNANINIIFVSAGGGVGVVRDNANGQETYMRMGELGLGLGAGIKDFRAVFVFHDPQTLANFIRNGWGFGGQADAAAKAGNLGAAVSGEAIIDNITIYQLTESGLALQVMVKGTRYWQDSALN